MRLLPIVYSSSFTIGIILLVVSSPYLFNIASGATIRSTLANVKDTSTTSTHLPPKDDSAAEKRRTLASAPSINSIFASAIKNQEDGFDSHSSSSYRNHDYTNPLFIKNEGQLCLSFIARFIGSKKYCMYTVNKEMINYYNSLKNDLVNKIKSDADSNSIGIDGVKQHQQQHQQHTFYDKSGNSEELRQIEAMIDVYKTLVAFNGETKTKGSDSSTTITSFLIYPLIYNIELLLPYVISLILTGALVYRTHKKIRSFFARIKPVLGGQQQQQQTVIPRTNIVPVPLIKKKDY